MRFFNGRRTAILAMATLLSVTSVTAWGTPSTAAVYPQICTKGAPKPCRDTEMIPVCEGEPCVEIGRLFFSTSGRVNVVWNGSADRFNIRWAIHSGGRVYELNQRSKGSGQRVDKLNVGPAARANKYTVSVQGCRTRFLRSSKCGEWAAGWIIPETGERYF
ncbi:hypothetical protein Ait01nite_016210 [Actinoplanes italicus]|uniref:Secreted protein n=1 Tax=Actinoplanes italicus TaxID=113567 RepID=A0A2T0JZ52_9ACTN|nr:hypothetical protein CLV67_12217 [Actinoplanes italicus]GIE28576.1 hypothetical protein Ait01nite_016210 [Actinoplanes italicus]